MTQEAKVARERTTERSMVCGCSNFRRGIEAHVTLLKGVGKLEETTRIRCLGG